MMLKELELSGFKSFCQKTTLTFDSAISAVVGPNGSGKSNVAEALRWVLGEQSLKSLRGKKGEDLVWNGSKSLSQAGRAKVKVTFDNSSKKINLDYDEVRVERVVSRDGINQYLLNGSQVRLKDVIEILAGIGLGASSHHIINQGEADHILAASPEERKSMLEDSLGLKIYQYKKEESAKKLEKTEENKLRVEALRLELAPHLKFLKKQMDKLERGERYREELRNSYAEYSSKERAYIEFEKRELAVREGDLKEALKAVRAEIGNCEQSILGRDDSSEDGVCESCGQLISPKKSPGPTDFSHYAKLQDEKSVLQSEYARLESEKERMALLENELKKEIQEGIAAVGRSILDYRDISVAPEADRVLQIELKKKIEKLKIRLEEMGVSGEDVITEYKEASRREAHFEKELADLNQSAITLMGIMKELSAKIEEEFSIGLTKINEEFNRFFSLIFGGGHASLAIVRDEERVGMDVLLSLPHKKIKSLAMLSGGERALTSIALLFAMSQVNPPPFMVLSLIHI